MIEAEAIVFWLFLAIGQKLLLQVLTPSHRMQVKEALTDQESLQAEFLNACTKKPSLHTEMVNTRERWVGNQWSLLQ